MRDVIGRVRPNEIRLGSRNGIDNAAPAGEPGGFEAVAQSAQAAGMLRMAGAGVVSFEERVKDETDHGGVARHGRVRGFRC